MNNLKTRQQKWRERNRDAVSENQRKYRANNQEKNKEYRKKKYQKQREIVDSLKKRSVCNRCKFADHRALVFHHTAEKDFQISSQIGKVGTKRLIEEISRCEILCANCHAIEHHPAVSN